MAESVIQTDSEKIAAGQQMQQFLVGLAGHDITDMLTTEKRVACEGNVALLPKDFDSHAVIFNAAAWQICDKLEKKFHKIIAAGREAQARNDERLHPSS